MTQDFKKAFEDLTDPVHPGFRAQLRSRLEAGRPRRTHAIRSFAALGSAAVVLLAVAAVAAGVGTRGSHAPALGVAPASASSPTAGTQVFPGPTGAPGAKAIDFNCSGSSTSGSPGGPNVTVTGERGAPQYGYDRFVIETSGRIPIWSVTPQTSTTFIEDGSGRPVTVAGTSGILVRVKGVSQSDWHPQRDSVVTGSSIIEVRRLGTFEGVSQWALGVQNKGCYTAYSLTGPDRLVIDVRAG